MEKIGERLKEIRIKNNLSQKDMANKLNIGTYQAYQSYEAGRSNPPLEILRKISKEFDIDLHWLITGKHYYDKKIINKIEKYSDNIDFLEENPEVKEVIDDILKDFKSLYNKIDDLKKVINKFK